MILACTGHRPDKLNNEYNGGLLTNWIINQLTTILENEKPEKIITGMAIGVDTYWAIAGTLMEIPVVAAIPFVGQDKIWPDKAKECYKNILNHPSVETFVVSDGGYAPWKMLKRNEWMVDNCDKLVAIWDGSKGGTSHCVGYAKKQGKEIIRINPEDFE